MHAILGPSTNVDDDDDDDSDDSDDAVGSSSVDACIDGIE
jgi:hypothetical protein